MRHKTTATTVSLLLTLLLTAAASESQHAPETGALELGSLQGHSHPFLQHRADAFDDQPNLPAEACLRDLYENAELLSEDAAYQAAQGRAIPSALAAMMRDTPRAAPRLVAEQLRCAQLGRSIAVLDLNRDGHLDLVVGTYGDGQLHSYLNDGTGQFTRSAYDPLGVGDTPSVEDVLRGVGNRYIEPSMFTCDLDGDGYGELITIYSGLGKPLPISVHATGPTFPDTPLWTVDTIRNVGAVGGATCGDVDGDGQLDLIYTIRAFGPQGADSPAIRVLINTGDGMLEDRTERWDADDERISSISPQIAVEGRWNILPFEPRLADLNNNGRLDLFVTADWGTPLLYENVGDRFHRHPTPLPRNYHTMGVVAIDVNGDGLLDLITSDIDLSRVSSCAWAVTCPADQQTSGANAVLINRGDMRFTSQIEQTPLAAFQHQGWGWGFTTSDLDGDSHWDIIQAGGELGAASENDFTWLYRSQPPAVLLGTPEGMVDRTRAWTETWNLANGSSVIVSADMTGNGVPDVVIYGEAVGHPQLYINTSDPANFTAIYLQSPGIVTIHHPHGDETFRLPDRHASFSATVDAPWPVGLGGRADVLATVTFDTGETRHITLPAGKTVTVRP